MQEMLGVNPEAAEQEIQGLLNRLDTDHSGTITFEGISSYSLNKIIFFFIEFKLFFTKH